MLVQELAQQSTKGSKACLYKFLGKEMPTAATDQSKDSPALVASDNKEDIPKSNHKRKTHRSLPQNQTHLSQFGFTGATLPTPRPPQRERHNVT